MAHRACSLPDDFGVFRTSTVSLAVSRISGVVIHRLLLSNGPTRLCAQLKTRMPSIWHLMHLSAHRIHAAQAFVFSHWQVLECFWHSSQILSRSYNNSSGS